MKNQNVKSNPFFDVTTGAVFANFNGQAIDTGKSAIMNAENGNIYGIVSPRYRVVTNDSVANIFEEAFKDYPVEKVKDHVNNDGGRWCREIIFGGQYQTEVKVGDVVKTKIMIHNGYDGLSSVGFNFGSERLVCTNGLTSFRSENKITFKHFTDGLIDKIQYAFEEGFKSFADEFDIYKKLAETPYTEKQFHKFILNEVKDDNNKGILSEKQASKILDIYPNIRNRYNDGDDTAWSHLNVLTAIQTHHTKAHNGSNLFSAGHRNIQQLINKFVEV